MKQLKDYIHLYIGCEVLITDEGLVKDLIEAGGNGRGVLTGLHGEYGPEFAANEGQHTSESPEYTWHLKLILRPLDEKLMTEQEKRSWNHYKQRKGWMPGVRAEQTLWLLSNGFDLFGLHAAGLAVYETETK
jgi:hypothetical protein